MDWLKPFKKWEEFQVIKKLLDARLLALKAERAEPNSLFNRPEALQAKSNLEFLRAKQIADQNGLDFERLKAAIDT